MSPRASSLLKGCVVVLNVAGSVLLSPVLAVADAKPAIQLKETSFDFGTVPQGSTVVHEFEVKNIGTADLIIQRLQPSCGCTATTISSPVVKPGASEKVRLAFDTSGFLGRKTKTVQIVTNDSEDPEKLFTLTGTVLSGYVLEPSKLDFGDVYPSTPAGARQKEVVLSIEEGSDLKVLKVSSLSNSLLISPVVTEGNRAAVKVELLPNAAKGEFRDRIVFDVDGGRRVLVNVPVSASIKGDVTINPSTVSFGVIEGQEMLERRLQFENRGEKSVSIESIRSSDPAVSGSFISVQPGKQGVVVIKVDPRLVKGDLKATVEVKTDHPTESVYSLNVFAIQPAR